MILPSTLRKLLRVNGASVLRVIVPQYTVALPECGPVLFPEQREYFATRSGADNWMANADPAQWGVTDIVMTVDKIPASALDPLTRREPA